MSGAASKMPGTTGAGCRSSASGDSRVGYGNPRTGPRPGCR
jgi:hypothetical protein